MMLDKITTLLKKLFMRQPPTQSGALTLIPIKAYFIDDSKTDLCLTKSELYIDEAYLKQESLSKAGLYAINLCDNLRKCLDKTFDKKHDTLIFNENEIALTNLKLYLVKHDNEIICRRCSLKENAFTADDRETYPDISLRDAEIIGRIRFSLTTRQFGDPEKALATKKSKLLKTSMKPAVGLIQL